MLPPLTKTGTAQVTGTFLVTAGQTIPVAGTLKYDYDDKESVKLALNYSALGTTFTINTWLRHLAPEIVEFFLETKGTDLDQCQAMLFDPKGFNCSTWALKDGTHSRDCQISVRGFRIAFNFYVTVQKNDATAPYIITTLQRNLDGSGNSNLTLNVMRADHAKPPPSTWNPPAGCRPPPDATP